MFLINRTYADVQKWNVTKIIWYTPLHNTNSFIGTEIVWRIMLNAVLFLGPHYTSRHTKGEVFTTPIQMFIPRPLQPSASCQVIMRTLLHLHHRLAPEVPTF